MGFFKPNEFYCRCGKCGLDGSQMHPSLLKALEAVRYEAGFSMPVDSGVRCPEWNAKQKGKPKSMHLEAMGACACDIACLDSSRKAKLVYLGLKNGLTIGVGNTFVHFDARTAVHKLKQIIFTY